MDDELRNARLKRDVMVAMLYAAEHAVDVLRVCAGVDGDETATREAIMAAFGFDEVQADAILAIQIRRLTPRGVEQYRAQLAELEEFIRKAERDAGTSSSTRG